MRLSQTWNLLLPRPLSSQESDGVTVKEGAGGSTSVCTREPLAAGRQAVGQGVERLLFLRTSSSLQVFPTPSTPATAVEFQQVPSKGKGNGGTRFILCLELKCPGGQHFYL